MTKKQQLELRRATCRCADEIAAMIKKKDADDGLDLLIFVSGAPSRPALRTCKSHQTRGRRGQVMVPLFCPFCGQAYPTLSSVGRGKKSPTTLPAPPVQEKN